MAELTITIIDGERDMNAAFAIRREVFCAEQGVPEAVEIDGLDPECRHYLARRGGDAVGTARTRSLGAEGGVKIERVAVLKSVRGAGIGKALMDRLLGDISAGPAVLNAQLEVEGFYAKLGFVSEGEVFQEAGIDHVRMTKDL
jgi:predicted GNAT family N-acyltransferase